ncbi:catalase family peroxidase [Peribacillus sp. SCS-37]|uniref:catalase family peroxidase n=1 Tax=Paraperibacillus esterisolvens TaxID=3115296 RepID=UPI003905C672
MIHNNKLAAESIDQIEKIGGRHPGLKRAHARGKTYEAIFTPSGRAAGLTSAPHLLKGETRAVVRFSNSSTNPFHPDWLTPPKGMAVQFQLPGGGITNLVCTTIPVFFARTPEAFNDIMKAAVSVKELKPDIAAFAHIIKDYPESRSFYSMIKEVRMPASYGMAQYYSIHAFYLVSEEGRKRAVKFMWKPEAGIAEYTKTETLKDRPHYLDEEMDERLSAGPVSFSLAIQIGGEDDPVDDPTVAWPEDSQQIIGGTLTITGEASGNDELLFDPTIMTEGIALTPDQILQFRHAAYLESYRRRHSEK